MHDHESRFHSPLGAEDVLEAFQQLVAAKRWQVTWEDEHRVHAQSGSTLRGAGEDIDVSAEPEDKGSQVHVAVKSRLGWWQLIDWGEARIFHQEIVAWLRTWQEGRWSRPQGVEDDGDCQQGPHGLARAMAVAGQLISGPSGSPSQPPGTGSRSADAAAPPRGSLALMTAGNPEPAATLDAGAAEPCPSIEISHLHKAYGETVAVDDVSFSVAEGEIFGLLGPNGAGKTTTVECAVGLRTADSGQVRILGLDPDRDRDRERLRLAVGVQLQSSALPAKLKVGELLDLYQSFYPDPADAGELAETLGLAGKRDDYYQSLSGGQKQRLSIALALIGQPKVAVLDEMTTGLDPHARRDTWDLIEQVRDRGVTILLVTHFMEEADRLCDQVALVDRGRVVAAGTPEELAQHADASKQVHFVPSQPFDDRLLTGLPEVSGVEHHGRRVQVSGTGDLASAVIQTLTAAGVTAHDVQLSSATLEDAFIELTGRRLAPAPRSAPRGRERGRPATRQRRPLLPKDTPRRAFAKLTQAEARLARRQPVGLVLGLAAPVLLLALFASFFRGPDKSLGGLSVAQDYLPVLIVFALAGLAFFSLPTPLATYREQGILRRLSTTPIPPAWVLGAQLVVNACIAVAGLAALLVVGIAGFGLTGPRSPGGFVLSIVLAGLAALAIGLCIAGTARTAAAAAGIGALAWYALMFFAGLFLPRQELPAVIQRISDWTPLGAAVNAIQRALQTGFPSASSLLILAGYAVVFGCLAVRYFRWE